MKTFFSEFLKLVKHNILLLNSIPPHSIKLFMQSGNYNNKITISLDVLT